MFSAASLQFRMMKATYASELAHHTHVYPPTPATTACNSLQIATHIIIHPGSNTHFIPNIPGRWKMLDPFDPHSRGGRTGPDIPHKESQEYPGMDTLKS